jgi:hypothetical protein
MIRLRDAFARYCTNKLVDQDSHHVQEFRRINRLILLLSKYKIYTGKTRHTAQTVNAAVPYRYCLAKTYR